jgi:hypothetical protein
MTMKTLICILAFALSFALLGCSQPVPDAPEVQVDAASMAAPDSSVPDARPAIVPDAAPAAPVDVPCVEQPAALYYGPQGQLNGRLYYRLADLGQTEPDAIYVCGDAYSASTTTTCTEDMTNCWVFPPAFPRFVCGRTFAQEDDTGRKLVHCGFRSEQDPDGDGVFETTTDITYTVEIR